MKIIISFLAFGLLLLGKMEAQILPPDFRCVRGDTLFWDLPTNGCGPFVGYEIWASQNPTGPFALQGSVSNQSQGFFTFVNPSGEQWYFYLLSNFNCPGQMALPSDTLDNRPPVVSPIKTVSVEGGVAVVTWNPSPSPEVSAYVIYRQTSIGVIPVDTVFSGNTYTDLASNPTAGSESYFVNAMDPCGNTSIFDVQHSSIFLEAMVVPCRQSVALSWNRYQGWANGIAEQQIWVGLNGGALTMVADAGTNANSFEVENVVDGAVYCFQVRTVEALTGAVAKSNEFCVTVDIFESAEGLFLQNISVSGGGEPVVTWRWPPLAELVEFQVLRSDQNADYQTIVAEATQPPLLAVNSYSDAASNASQEKVFYKIQSLDVCDSVRTTNYGSTIHLTVDALPGNVNKLNWTEFDIENASVNGYSIYKIVGGNESLAGTVGGSTTTFEDNYLPTSIAEASACYYVVAKSEVAVPNGQPISQESRSNTACVEQRARIYAPNAFVPEGLNQEFRPLLVLGDIASYEMRIFDRYGQEVFMTKTVEQGWDGRKGNRNLAQGIYAYVIKVTQVSGKISEKRGTVLLIR